MWRYWNLEFLFPFSCSAFFDCQMYPQNTVNSVILTSWKLDKNQKQYPDFYMDSNQLCDSLNLHLIKNFFCTVPPDFFNFLWHKQCVVCYSNFTLRMKINPELHHILQLLPKIQQSERAEQLNVTQSLLKSVTSNFHIFLLHSKLWTTQVSYHRRGGLASHHHHIGSHSSAYKSRQRRTM